MKGPFQTMAGLIGGQAKAVDASNLTWEVITGAPSSKSGVSVGVDSALRVSTVLACVRVVSEGVAQLPLKVGRVDDETDAFTPAKDIPAYRMLYRRPNDFMTSFELREFLVTHAMLGPHGCGFAVKNIFRGEVRELLPVPSNCVSLEYRPNFGVIYHVNDPFGLVGSFTRKDLLILKGPAWYHQTALNMTREAREAIGLAIATEEAHARLHANGMRLSGVFSVDGALGDEARERIRASAESFRQRDRNGFGVMVLDKGGKFTPTAMTGVDSQHLETRRLQIEEICRFFRVFPHMVGYSDKTATFASAESFFQGHVLHTLVPWCERMTQAIERDVLFGDPQLEARFEYRQLIRGDTMARSQFYAQGIQAGWLTRNDARRFEDLAPLPGLDEPLQALNLSTVDQAIAAAESPKTAKAIRLVVDNELKGWPADMDADERETRTALMAVRINEVLLARAA